MTLFANRLKTEVVAKVRDDGGAADCFGLPQSTALRIPAAPSHRDWRRPT